MSSIDWIVLVAYASLLLELVAFPIPSEASTWQLLAAGREAHGATPVAGELARARQRATLAKVVLYFVPTAIGVVLFVLPLVSLVSDAIRAALTSPSPPALQLLGAGLILGGRALTFTSVLQLRAARATHGAPRGLAHGVFCWSRNPGLVGMYGFYAGLCLTYLSPYMALGFPLYVANMHRRVRMEESHLELRLGDAWRAYRAAVPRYVALPGLR